MNEKQALVEALKKQMDYSPVGPICENCVHFTGPDYSGNHNSKFNECTLNPTSHFRVDPKGGCKFFSKKPPKEDKS